jgi:SAM-dependent methyltransferase
MADRIELVDRVTFIKRSCEGRSVLHLGCTNWPYTAESFENNVLLHTDLSKISTELYGFDLDQEGIDSLAERGFGNLFRANLERLEDVTVDRTFDVIVAGEIIEHLNNPGLFLEGVKRFMDRRSKLVITTINAYSALRFAIYALRGRGGFNEPVHPDHIAYFSYRTLSLLVKRHDLVLEKFCFYDVGPEHRRFSPWYYNFVNDVGVWCAPWLCDGVIATCVLPSEEDDDG